MALAAINVTIGANLGGGTFSSTAKSRKLPLTSMTTVSAALVTAQSAITAALAIGNISGDPTSLTAVTLVQTDVTAVQTAVAAVALSIDADVSVVINTSNITTRNQLRHALRVAMQAIEGSDVLTA